MFLAAHRYRLDDFRPWIYVTNDYGKTWRLLTDGKNGISAGTPTRVVREDPERRGLLYAGTERGLFVSFDDGARWQSLQLNLPQVPVTDLRVHRKDLVVSTQGRSFWILDDVTPLHALAAGAPPAPHLFPPRDADRAAMAVIRGGNRSLAENPPYGAAFYYTLPADPKGEVTLDIWARTAGRWRASRATRTRRPTRPRSFR